mgnify:CR=1 FL=1
MKVVIYARVSTNSQDYKRQTEELKEFSNKMNYEVVSVFEEKISGAKTNEERPQLMKMINFIKSNKIDKVLCWELSLILYSIEYPHLLVPRGKLQIMDP